MAKYDPLKQYLQHKPGPTITMSFAEVADLVGGLPNSAYKYREWWANGGHVQADSWMGAGWRVDSIHLAQRRVSFRRWD